MIDKALEIEGVPNVNFTKEEKKIEDIQDSSSEEELI